MTDRHTVPVPGMALDHLRSADPTMAGLVERIGVIEHAVEPDLWRSIVGSIVGQQLSVAAAATIRARVAALSPDGYPTPELIASVPDEVLRACGLSRAKTVYVRDAASAWRSGEIRPEEIVALPDEQVIERLVRIRGVGRWTAEMVLIFCLGRPDVLAVDDLGIRAAVQRAYELPERPGRDALLELGRGWSPYRSYASLYLWRSLKL